MARRGGRLLFAPRRKRRPGCLITFLFFVLVVGIAAGLNAVNNGHVTLEKRHVTVPTLDKALEGFKILHISDMQGKLFGPEQERLYQLIRLERYHAVCLSGDMVGKQGDAKPLLTLLDRIPDEVPVFLIAGDDDPAGADFIEQARARGAVYLDSPQFVQMGARRVWFSPAWLFTTNLEASAYALTARRAELAAANAAATPEGAARLQAVDDQLRALTVSQGALQQMDARDAQVLVSHLPLDAEEVDALHEGEGPLRKAVNAPGLVSLILSGHWNDGQWRLPVLGPVYVPGAAEEISRWLPGSRALSGLTAIHGVAQHVSPGLGYSSVYPFPRTRLFNRPRITMLTLSARFADAGVQ